jgi:phage gp36-like protein
MSFLTEIDYQHLIKEVFLQQVSENDNSTLIQAEGAAIEEVASYLSGRYDTAQIFIEIPFWNALTLYALGQQVLHLGGYWVALNDTLNEEPGTGPSWVQRDDRNPKIVQICVDFTLYHLHSRIAKRQMPELRAQRYEEGLAYLSGIVKRTINPNLPVPADPAPKQPVQFGSLPRRCNAL